MLSFFPPDVLDETWDLIEPVSRVFLPTLARGKFIDSLESSSGQSDKILVLLNLPFYKL